MKDRCEECGMLDPERSPVNGLHSCEAMRLICYLDGEEYCKIDALCREYLDGKDGKVFNNFCEETGCSGVSINGVHYYEVVDEEQWAKVREERR